MEERIRAGFEKIEAFANKSPLFRDRINTGFTLFVSGIALAFLMMMLVVIVQSMTQSVSVSGNVVRVGNPLHSEAMRNLMGSLWPLYELLDKIVRAAALIAIPGVAIALIIGGAGLITPDEEQRNRAKQRIFGTCMFAVLVFAAWEMVTSVDPVSVYTRSNPRMGRIEIVPGDPSVVTPGPSSTVITSGPNNQGGGTLVVDPTPPMPVDTRQPAGTRPGSSMNITPGIPPSGTAQTPASQAVTPNGGAPGSGPATVPGSGPSGPAIVPGVASSLPNSVPNPPAGVIPNPSFSR